MNIQDARQRPRTVKDLYEESNKIIKQLNHPLAHYSLDELITGRWEVTVPHALGNQTFSERPSQQDMDVLAAYAIRTLRINTALSNVHQRVADALAAMGLSLEEFLATELTENLPNDQS